MLYHLSLPILAEACPHLHPHKVCGWYQVKGMHQNEEPPFRNILTSWKICPPGPAWGLTKVNIHEAWKKRSPFLLCVDCMTQYCKMFKASQLPACISYSVASITLFHPITRMSLFSFHEPLQCASFASTDPVCTSLTEFKGDENVVWKS